MKKSILLILLLFVTINLWGQEVTIDEKKVFKTKFDDAIPVLNVATFHMGETPDAHSTDFDEHDKGNQLEVKKVAKVLAEFKPTIIVVEALPKNDSKRQADYLDYINNPNKQFQNPDEIVLLAYEVGRLSGAKRIHGIDFREEYNYSINVENGVDTTTINKYLALIDENNLGNLKEEMSFYELFKLNNHPQYLESLINFNADLLTYISSKGNSEGADEAAKFYHRNLVMFSNLNQIPVTKSDRIFILMGGGHTAFFMDFLRRSPKYTVDNIFDYLK